MTIFNRVIFSSLIIIATSCNTSTNTKARSNTEKLPFDEAPTWSQNAIWYQIFAERFRNGDTLNDPKVSDIKHSYPHTYSKNWSITPWGQQWYKMSSWETEEYGNDFYKAAQSRRYGGDLQGVLDKLDYFQDLGITAIFFNPLNDSPSLHKYDATNYAHIDHTFGPDPKGDLKLMKSEDPTNPKTWNWTSADKMFLKVIEEAHKRGMRVILDYSWNHTGTDNPIFKDIVKNQSKSKYKDFYMIKSFDNPSTPENEFDYDGWFGIKSMPEIKKVDVVNRKSGNPYEGNIQKDAKQYIFDVSKRWLDPNNDGDTSDGIDGFRLDVADQIPMGFWRDYRKYVRSVNPETYLVGEIWWKTWPDSLMDPRPYVKGDVFDAVMHYQFYKPARRFFAEANGGYSPTEYKAELKKVFSNYRQSTRLAMMNMSASHDSPRLSTSFYNKEKYKFNAKPQDNDDYKTTAPDEQTWKEIKQYLVHQFTFIGSPQIWQGDEFGMWGADDPDNRKPVIWDDYNYETETLNYKGENISNDKVSINNELLSFYKKLISIRKNNSELVYGDVDYIKTDDTNKIFAYSRSYKSNTSYVIFNLNNTAEQVVIDAYEHGIYVDLFTGNEYKSTSTVISLDLAPKSFIIIKKKN
jgi:glycosidase